MIDRMFAFMKESPGMVATLARYSATKTATGYEATVFYNSAEQYQQHVAAWETYPTPEDFEKMEGWIKMVDFEVIGEESELAKVKETLIDGHPGCRCTHVVPSIEDYPHS